MKKQTLIYIAMLLLPVAAAGLAASPESVAVCTQERVEYYSFHDQIPGVSVGVCFVISVLLNDLCFFAGVIHGLTKKKGWLNGVFFLAFAAVSLAVLPIVVKGEITVLPNMAVPLLMGAECLLAYILLRKPIEQKNRTSQGPRLQAR